MLFFYCFCTAKRYEDALEKERIQRGEEEQQRKQEFYRLPLDKRIAMALSGKTDYPALTLGRPAGCGRIG